jgi:hypothetical protein
MRADHTSFLFELRRAVIPKFLQYACLFSLFAHRFFYLTCHVKMGRSAKETRNTKNSEDTPNHNKDRSSNSPLPRPRQQYPKPPFRAPQPNAPGNASPQVY